MDNFIPPWEWDWHWGVFGIYAGFLFIFGLICHLIGLPGIIPVVIGGILGACAGQWEWFER